MTYDERGNGDLIASLGDSQVTGNDLGSQEIDLLAEQADDGFGTLTLENTNLGNSVLNGVEIP